MAGRVERKHFDNLSIPSNGIQFIQLPNDLLARIFALLSAKDLLACNLVQRAWRQELETNHALWKQLFERHLPLFSLSGIDNLERAYHQNAAYYWNLSQGSFCCDTLTGHQSGHVSHLRFIGKDLCSAALWDPSEAIKIWNVTSRACKRNIKTRASSVSSIAGTAMKLFAGSIETSGSITVFDWTSDKTLVTSLRGHTREVAVLEVAEITLDSGEKKTVLISGSADKTIKIWDGASFCCLGTLEGHAGEIKTMVVVNNTLFSGSEDRTIGVWELSSFKQISFLKGHREQIKSLAFGNGRLFSASSDHSGGLRIIRAT